MLNLNCVICAEIFTPTDDVHVTSCGHMFHLTCLNQWLQRSKTCPQCRNRCTDRNVLRVYFNLANLDVSRIDVGSLQEQLDNINLQLKVKEKELNKAEEQIKSSKDTQKKCMKTIASLEKDLKSKNFLILNYVEKIKLLESHNKVMENLRKENKELKEHIETMESVNTLLTSTMADAEKLLRNENDPKILSVWVTTLKRELRVCETKKTDLRNVLRVVQNDLRKEIEHKKSQDERISRLESENYELLEKIADLEAKTKNNNNDTAMKSNNSTIGLNTALASSFASKIKEEEKRLTISPTIKDNIKKIEESSSPYLNIKSCGVLFPQSLMRNHENRANKDSNTKFTTVKFRNLNVSPIKKLSSRGVGGAGGGAIRKTTSDLSDKYTIFKKPRLGLAAGAASTSTTSKPLASNFVFNGFGGSERVDPFLNKADSGDDCFVDCEPNTVTSDKTTAKQKTSGISSINSRLKSGNLRNLKLNDNS